MLEMPSGTGKTVSLLSLIVASILFYSRVTVLEMPSGTRKTMSLSSLIVASILFYSRVTVCWRCPLVQGRL